MSNPIQDRNATAAPESGVIESVQRGAAWHVARCQFCQSTQDVSFVDGEDDGTWVCRQCREETDAVSFEMWTVDLGGEG